MTDEVNCDHFVLQKFAETKVNVICSVLASEPMLRVPETYSDFLCKELQCAKLSNYYGAKYLFTDTQLFALQSHILQTYSKSIEHLSLSDRAKMLISIVDRLCFLCIHEEILY